MMRAISQSRSGFGSASALARLAAVVMAALLLAGPAVAQELYKWVGEDGSTHYSAHPPQDREYQVVDMAAGRLSFVDPAEDLIRPEDTADNGEASSDEGERDERRDPETMDPAARADYCDDLDERLRWLVAGRADMLSDVYPEEEVRNRESRGELIEELAAQIDETCQDDD